MIARAPLALLGALALAAPAGAAERELRVCADPNNLPFSNQQGEGFENKIAELVAEELGAELSFTWWAQRRGFIRNTLNAGACDLLIGVPAGYELVATTAAYYRSSYVYVYRADRGLDLHSMQDPLLRDLRIGVHLIGDDGTNPPPAHALGAQGIVDNVFGYMIYGDYREPNPPARVIEAVAAGDLDVAAVWGPFGGYFAKQAPIYSIGLARLWRRAGRGRGIETWRAGCFVGAMLALSLALIWPFDVLGGSILSAHMVQHVLLTTVAAPLLILSAPLTVGLWALPLGARRAVGGVGHARGVRQGWRWLTLPLFAWAFYALSLWLWHMPPFYEAAARDWLVHLLEHLCFLASALVLWWTALLSARTSALGVGAGIFLLFTTAVQDGLLGALLVFSQRPLYGFYVEAAHLLGRDPLADQQLAGVIMWVFGGMIYLCAALALAWRFLLPDERASARLRA